MNYSKNYQISLTTNDDINFGYIMVDTPEQANILFDQLSSGCYLMGKDDNHHFGHTPEIELAECIYDENEISVAQKALRRNLLGDENTPTQPLRIDRQIIFDTVNYYQEPIQGPAFGLTL